MPAMVTSKQIKIELQCDYDFNLHVTVTQKLGRRKMETDIIINPSTDNGFPNIP